MECFWRKTSEGFLIMTAELENKNSLTINIRGSLRDFRRPWVMGIVNVTPDSFYSESRTFDSASIAARVVRLVEDGADCLDIGGYSSRPGAGEVDACEEYRRVAMALEIIRRECPETIVSVDTFRADVALRCIDDYGIDIVNDISGGDLDPAMWELVAEKRVAYVLMHMRGNPATMQSLTDYGDVLADVVGDLAFKVGRLRQMGVADIIVDPGFGFAKTIEQNFRLLDNLDVFHELGCPVLAGMSHKTMVWKTLGITPEESANGTVVVNTMALMKDADILRVHDVAPAVEAVRLAMALENSRKQ